MPAAKPTAKLAPPPYEGQDPDIDGRNKLVGLDRLDKLRGGLGLTGSRGLWLDELDGSTGLTGLPT